MIKLKDLVSGKLTGHWPAALGDRLYVVNTGDWRYQRPVTDPNKCKRCGACFIFCPVGCKVELETHFDTDLSFCKGCGICAQVCPAGAIVMYEEVRI